MQEVGTVYELIGEALLTGASRVWQARRRADNSEVIVKAPLEPYPERRH